MIALDPIVKCDNDLCQNGSTCVPSTSTTTNFRFTCKCRPGFSGEHCEKSKILMNIFSFRKFILI